MWTSTEIKKEAWSRLSGNLWTGILATLVVLGISQIFQMPSGIISAAQTILQYRGGWDSLPDISAQTTAQLSALGTLQSMFSLAAFAAAMLLVNPLYVGYARWFLANRDEDYKAGIDQIFFPFHQGTYGGILSGTAWKYLWTYIWSMVAGLCLIPAFIAFFAVIIMAVFSYGNYSAYSVSINPSALWDSIRNIRMEFWFIIGILFLLGILGSVVIMMNRRYAYLFMSFILAEDPCIGARKALDRSKSMAYGLKRRLFVLDLSFIGWWMLSAMTCGILSLGVMPYLHAAYAEIYLRRKEELHIA